MIVISVTLRVPLGEFETFKPAMEAVITKSRTEPGVIAYSFAVDILDPSLIRIFEIYRDQSALDAHHASSHFQAWRPLSAKYAREDRRILESVLRS